MSGRSVCCPDETPPEMQVVDDPTAKNFEVVIGEAEIAAALVSLEIERDRMEVPVNGVADVRRAIDPAAVVFVNRVETHGAPAGIHGESHVVHGEPIEEVALAEVVASRLRHSRENSRPSIESMAAQSRL